MASSKFSDIIQSDIPVLVDFYANWCGPCRMVAPILNDLKKALGDKVKVVKIDVDKNQQLAGALNVSGIPTLIIFKNGEQKWRNSGVVPLPQLKNTIEQFI